MDRQPSIPAATWTQASQPLPRRDVWQAMARGLRCRCPNCGKGKIFRAFLKVADKCSECGQDFSGHRADDLPAYLVIVIVGHIIVPIVLWIETDYAPPVPLQLAIYLPLTLISALLLLQPVKGAVVGLQWAFRMHGFDESRPEGVEEGTIENLNVAK
ncbi:DUF983 domain-containing protein [Bradyrhizobium sp. G127]|jgi:uncharacterized protein (DUF983 family)|uniref:DUF983 domain-containing protein n=1 Tax=Bradyrhizobium sp. G127 TaxID=2904800 RepID=UPI001F2E1DDC|nr:DUF983 domain-containing protein [Bradyrhizobium sp. G127]MCF2523984.1 DUF983 domain-containing protein [Bradyrhizobium sp. G127]